MVLLLWRRANSIIIHFNPRTIRVATALLSLVHIYSLIALAIARAITGHAHTSKSTDYYPNLLLINYTNSKVIPYQVSHSYHQKTAGAETSII